MAGHQHRQAAVPIAQVGDEAEGRADDGFVLRVSGARSGRQWRIAARCVQGHRQAVVFGKAVDPQGGARAGGLLELQRIPVLILRIVDRQAVFPVEPSEPATQSQPGDSGRRVDPGGHGKSESLRFVVEITERRSG